jgi:hypothetical protein
MEKDLNLGLNILGIYLGVALVAIVSTIAVIPLFVWSLFSPLSVDELVNSVLDGFSI